MKLLAARTAIGILGAFALICGLPAAMTGWQDQSTLTVVASDATRGYHRSGGELSAEVYPREIVGRLTQNGEVTTMEPGIWLRSWRTTYGKQWEKEVSLPLVVGTAGPPNSLGICGYELRIGAALLDPERAAPAIKEIVRRAIFEEWPRVQRKATEQRVTLEKLSRIGMTTRTTNGKISGELSLTMVDDAALLITFEIYLGVANGALSVEIRNIDTQPNSKLVRKGREVATSSIFWTIANAISLDYVGRTGERELRAKVKASVEQQARTLSEAMTEQLRQLQSFPVPGGATRYLHVQFSDAPAISEHGVVLYPCLGATLAGSEVVDPTFLRPISRAAPPPKSLKPVNQSELELSVNVDGMNQVLFLAWQLGAFASLGEGLLSAAKSNGLIEKLSFNLEGIQPLLPPYVLGSGSRSNSFGIAAYNLRLGTWSDTDRTEVVGHLRLEAQVGSDENSVQFTGAATDVRANCIQNRLERDVILTPCLGDLVPVARVEFIGEPKTYSIPTAPWFDSLRRQAWRGIRADIGSMRLTSSDETITAAARVAFVDAGSAP